MIMQQLHVGKVRVPLTPTRSRWQTIALLCFLSGIVGCTGGTHSQTEKSTVPPFPTGHPLPMPSLVVIGKQYEDFGLIFTPINYKQTVDPAQVCYSYLCQKSDLHYSGLEYTINNMTATDLKVVPRFMGMDATDHTDGSPEVIDNRDFHIDPSFPRSLIQVPAHSTAHHTAYYLRTFPSDHYIGIYLCVSSYDSNDCTYTSPSLFILDVSG